MPSTRLKRLQDDWPLLTYYQKFESIVALILTLIIGLIIVVALFRLTFAVVSGLLLGAFDPLNHEVFQAVFGEIMTLLIALEFNHTLQYVVTRQQSISVRLLRDPNRHDDLLVGLDGQDGARGVEQDLLRLAAEEELADG